MRISIGNSRMDKKWKQVDLTWPQFIEEARKHLITGSETHAQYMAMPKAQQDQLKDNGGFVAAALAEGRRKRGCCTERSMITLDIDNAKAGTTQALCEAVIALGFDYLIYSTRKHEPAHPRIRAIIPIDRPVSADEYQPLARAAAQMIDDSMEVFDPTTFEAERLMYWPSASSDSEVVFRSTAQGKPLPADVLLSTYGDWHNAAEWPLCPAESAPKRPGGKQADPTQKQGLVGAFCRVYDVPAAIDKFLPEAYHEASPGRYTYTPGSTTGGAVLYDGGSFLYSHHSTDPAGGKLVNAWDLVRIHRFGNLDLDVKPDTPNNRLPSYQAMCELAGSDPTVAGLLREEREVEALSGFEPVEEGHDWHERLEYTNKGELLATVQNMWLILRYDPALSGKIWNDLFSMRRMCCGPFLWSSTEGERGWSDDDDAGLRYFFETVYHLTGRAKIDDALRMAAAQSARDPVVDYLNSLKWDGKPRLDTVFIDYLGANDNEYTRAVARKSLVAGVARAIQPGYKYDQVVIFSGPQGIGKSSFLRKMGRKWFSDSITSFQGKDARESLRGVWVVELGELTALDKSEAEAAKQFISQCEDWYRPSYGQNTQQYPRRCVFFGTSNKTEFLRDSTGNRRFWPIDVYRKQPKYDIRVMDEADWLNDETVDQLWAEAMVYYQLGEKTYISGALQETAVQVQAEHQEDDQWIAAVRDFVERPTPKGWRNGWDLEKRQLYWEGSYQDPVETEEREAVCVAEVWCECLHGRIERIDTRDQRRIAAALDSLVGWERATNVQRFKPYGRQRYWRKVCQQT